MTRAKANQVRYIYDADQSPMRAEIFCTKCRTYQPPGNFDKGSGRPCRLGYAYNCKPCRNARRRARTFSGITRPK